MKKVPKAASWEETLSKMRAQLLIDDNDRADVEKRIAALEHAISVRSSLSSSSGKIAFNL